MSDSSNDLAKELQATFIVECSELLTSLESNLILYEKNRNRDILNEILRDLHSIKGSSKAVGFEALTKFVHSLEDYVSKYQTLLNINFCLKAKDQMAKFIEYQKYEKLENATKIMQTFKWIT